MKHMTINIDCSQETKWEGHKTKYINYDYKLLYVGKDNNKNGVGMIADKETKNKIITTKLIKGDRSIASNQF